MQKEKKYKDMTVTAKKGLDKYSELSSSGMKEYREKYKKKTGKNPHNIQNKEHFYSWIARNKIRNK